MSAIDISRHLFQPEKRYSGVLRLQGRVLLDSDENERSMIERDDFRRALIDIICARGARGDGFKIANVRATANPDPAGKLDFDILPGAMYLGGMRFESVPQGGVNERFFAQPDWLQMGIGSAGAADRPDFPSVGDLGTNRRFDLVFMEGFEQAVTATEDSEFLERALGGPDTSARVRRTRRIRVKTGVGNTCAAAFNDLIAQLETGGVAAFDRQTCELAGTTLLQITLAGPTNADDPCAPLGAGGYLGAANETIRIAITEPGRFVWSFGNAAPLYRVMAHPYTPPPPAPQTTSIRRIEFFTPPADQASQPLAGDVVEIMPWGALLPNAEKLVDQQSFFAVVESPYDPDSKSILINMAVPTEWTTFPPALRNPRDESGKRDYLYLRVWRGETNTTAAPGQQINLANPVPLGATGLAAKFSDNGRRSDYWVVAARPHTPQTLVPWNLDLAPGVPPVGPRRFYAPLALIEWFVQSNAVAFRLHDCRERFRPLCEQGGCCEITVGDGETSHGHVSSIQQAIDLLPAEGGKVCVLKGTYREHVKIDARRNIIIEGCGPLTRIEALAGSKRPLFSVRNTVGLTVRDMALRAPESLCFAIEEMRPIGAEFGPNCRDIVLRNLAMVSRDAPAVFFKDGSVFRMNECQISHEPLQAALAAGQIKGLAQCVLLLGRNMRVERCVLRHGLSQARAVTALGGIHVFGNSRRVEIVGNEILEGNGIGVRLGSVRFVSLNDAGVPDPRFTAAPLGPIYDVDWTGELSLAPNMLLPANAPVPGGYRLFGTVVIKPDGCIEIGPPEDPGGDGGPQLVPVADPPIVDLLIEANRIENMGGSGIAVDRFFDLETRRQMIVVSDTRIFGNRILRCLTQGCPETLRQGNLALYAAVGGIALAWAQDLTIRDNVIADCAELFNHPICGVFVLLSEGFVAQRNRIENNGARAPENQVPPDGRRGGIVLSHAMALGEASFAQPPTGIFAGLRDRVTAAAIIEENAVVQPEGRALRIFAIGPVHVHGNRLVSRGAAADTAALLRFLQQMIAINTVSGVMGNTASPLAVAKASPTQIDLFLSLLGGSVVSIIAPAISNEFFLYMSARPTAATTGLVEGPSIDAARQHLQFRRLVGGNVLFNDNQVVFDAIAPGSALSASAILILSLDDVMLDGNQSDCDLVDDFFLSNTMAVGLTVRATANRFKTSITNALISAATYGWMNMTATNQGTHCFQVVSHLAGERTATPNHVLVRGLICQQAAAANKPCENDPCRRLDAIGAKPGGLGVAAIVGGQMIGPPG